MFFQVGVSGLTVMPYVFQVVTRAILWEMNNNPSFDALLRMYVDNGIIVCLKQDVQHTQSMLFSFVRNLLGANAIEASKTREGRQVDFIGYIHH
jgi:hypothetical protein